MRHEGSIKIMKTRFMSNCVIMFAASNSCSLGKPAPPTHIELLDDAGHLSQVTAGLRVDGESLSDNTHPISRQSLHHGGGQLENSQERERTEIKSSVTCVMV